MDPSFFRFPGFIVVLLFLPRGWPIIQSHIIEEPLASQSVLLLPSVQDSQVAGAGIGVQALYHPSPVPLSNPRDHSVLQTIYELMHAARGIRLDPCELVEGMMRGNFQGKC